jgi:iron-sulfur cluster repair protein YtfE (RIC family)
MTPPSTPASRAAEALEFFTAHLAGHFRAEEDVLFPAIAAHVSPHEPTAALLRDLVADHRELESLRDAVANARSASEGEGVLTIALRNFADALERHVRREERELFAEFSTLVTDAEAAILGPRIRDVLSARRPPACRTDGQSNT